MIPTNITSEHIIKAIEQVKKQGVPERRDSTKYALVYKEKHYPPKFTLSLANYFANGEELQPSEFSGGDETNTFLRKLGFIVVDELNDTPLNDKQLVEQFHKDVIHAYKKAKSECGYNASIFIQLVTRDGALKVAKDFIYKKQATSGFEKLYFAGRLDLTVEAHVLLPKYKVLFTVEERKAAFERLKEYKYEMLGVTFDSIDLQTIQEDIRADNIENEHDLKTEGSIKTYFGKRYERDAENRQKAIEIHGLNCVVCNFNFEEAYGERGNDFIEVHHVKPLSTLGGVEVKVDPATDLVPLCANCHRMIHRRHDNVLSIEQLKAIVKVRQPEVC